MTDLIVTQGYLGNLFVVQGYLPASAAAIPCFGTATPAACIALGTHSITACIGLTTVTKPSPVNFS